MYIYNVHIHRDWSLVRHSLLSSSGKGLLVSNPLVAAERMSHFLASLKMGEEGGRLKKQVPCTLVSIPPQLEMFLSKFPPITNLKSPGHSFLPLSLFLEPSILVVLHFPPFAVGARMFSSLPSNYLDTCQCVLVLCNTWLHQRRRRIWKNQNLKNKKNPKNILANHFDSFVLKALRKHPHYLTVPVSTFWFD